MSRDGRRKLGALLLIALLSTGAAPSPVWAQADPSDDKVETKLGAVDAEDAKIERATLKNDESDPNKVRAEEFARQRKFDSIKKVDENIARLKNLIDKAPKGHPDVPEFMFNLAELNWEKSKMYEVQAYQKQDECFALEDKKDEKGVANCKRTMNDMLAEAKRLREQTVQIYVDLIQGYKDFKYLDEVYYYLGTNLMEVNKRNQALEVFRSLIREYPQSKYVANVLVAFGDYYFDADEMDQAYKAYDKVTQSYAESGVYGYATYKKAWCMFNMDNKEKSLELFLETINHAKKRPDLPNSTALMKQARKDVVMTYAFIGAASKAIPFFKKITNDDREEWLGMGERLAMYYSDKGKFEDSMAMYRELIKLNKDSVRVVDYQLQVVANQTSRDAYSKETLEELVLLLRLVQLADQGSFKDVDDKYKKDTRPKVEEVTRNWATIYHREAQQTKNPDLYAKAYYLYKFYLDAYQDSPQLYQMTFFYGELLYKLQKWEEAAAAYEKATQIDDKGKFTQEIVHGQVLAYFKLVSVSEEKAQLSEGAAALTSEEEGAKKEIPKPQEIPELKMKLINACKRYVELAPDGDRIVDVKYTMARMYYDYFHLNEAVTYFKDIAYAHSKSRLAVLAANQHLDSLNSLQNYDAMEVEVRDYLEKKPIEDEEFLTEVEALYAAIGFKKCTVLDDTEKWKEAATCFVEYYRRFPESEHADDALYNAALDYERLRELGKAIQVRMELLQSQPESTWAPITLYNIGGNYHALAIYTQAARFYELFVSNFPDHEKSEDALANASTFRQGLGEYDRAIAAYNRYLELFSKAKPDKAAEVFFQIAKIYEQQGKAKSAFDQYTAYLAKHAKNGSNDNRLMAHVKLGLYFWAREGRTNRKKALAEFERTLKEYERMSDADKAAMTRGRDAAAQAMFMIGEDVFESMAAMDINSKDEKELQKRLAKKLERAKEAKAIYEKVILFKRPDWAIASLYRLGSNMENFANSIRKSPCAPRLTYDQCEIYKGLLEDTATGIENDSVTFYVKSLETARQASWFNQYTKQAETALAKLRPREYRKPSELRAEPDHVQMGLSTVDFLLQMKEEDRLTDMERGADAAESDSGAQ